MASPNPAVVTTDADLVIVSQAEVDDVIERVHGSPNGRARLCAHRSSGERFQEMIIVHRQDAYLRPHRHPTKAESLHIVDGLADIVVFDDGGSVREAIAMGPIGSGRPFYIRINIPAFHTIRSRTEYVVVHESTDGPMDHDDLIFAPWAPDQSMIEASRAYMADLDARILAISAKS